MSAKSLPQKFFIKQGEKILVIDPPDGFMPLMTNMPEDVTIQHEGGGPFDQVHAFCQTQIELENLLPRCKSLKKEGGKIWLAYPKGTSKKYQAEINRDAIWKYARTQGLDAVGLVAIDEDWSSMRRKTLV